MLTRLVVCAVKFGVVVVEIAAGVVVVGLDVVVVVGALVAVAVLAVVVASTGGVCLAGTMVVLVDAGATVGFGVTVVVVLGELLTVPAHKPLELDCSFFSFPSIDGLKSAGIKIRRGLSGSIRSPRCPGLS